MHRFWALIGVCIIKISTVVHESLNNDIAEVGLIWGPWCCNWIPPEVLCEIFHCYMLSFQSSAWKISQVYCIWQWIPHECSTLWNKIHIPSYSLKFSSVYRSRDPLGWDCHVTKLRAPQAIWSRTVDQLRAPRCTNVQVLHMEGIKYLRGGEVEKQGNSLLGERKGFWNPARTKPHSQR